MKRMIWVILVVGLVMSMAVCAWAKKEQEGRWAGSTVIYTHNGSGLPVPVSSTDPIPVSGTITPSGTQTVGQLDPALLKATCLLYDSDGAAITGTNGLYVRPGSNIADATYIGDIKFGEELPAGTQNIGDVDIATIAAGSNIIGQVSIDQTTPGTTNGVQINAAIPAGTNNIGDMDILSIAAGVNVIGGVRDAKVVSRKTSSQDLSAAALSYTTNFAARTSVSRIMLHASGAITQTITVTIDSADGANYDTVLFAEAVTAAQDVIYTPDGELVLDSGDEVKIECTASGSPAVTVYPSIIGETLL